MIPPGTRFRVRHDSELGELFVCDGCRRIYACGDEPGMALHRCDPADLRPRGFPWYAIAVIALLIAAVVLAVLLGLMRAAAGGAS